MNKTNILTLIYIFCLVLGFFYVRSVIDTSKQPIDQKSNDEQEIEEIKPIKVTFTFGNFTETVRMQNINNVDDLLDKLYGEKKLTYEKTAYIYGTEISEINRVKSSEFEKWIITKNESVDEVDLGERLEDGASYRLVLVKK